MTNRVRIDWKPLPGYEGFYWMYDGKIYNRRGKPLKYQTRPEGVFVELRKNGQREVVNVDSLLKGESQLEVD